MVARRGRAVVAVVHCNLKRRLSIAVCCDAKEALIYVGEEARARLTHRAALATQVMNQSFPKLLTLDFLMMSLRVRLSIIVPLLNEQQRLRSHLLPSIARLYQHAKARGLPYDIEWIFVDGASTDDGNDLVRTQPAEYRCRLIGSERGRAIQMNHGAAHARGTTLLFLHADCVLPDDLFAVLDQLQQARWGCFIIRLRPCPGILPWVERGINWRVRARAVATGDQAMFVSADVFSRLGGYTVIPLMEDMELSRRLRKIAKPFIVLSPVEVDSRRWLKKGVAITVVHMWFIQWCYFLGVAPERLYRWYYNKT